MLITPLTELDAVNEILASIGEAPINTLDEVENVDAMNALRILKNVSRNTQEEGWSFNTYEGYELVPDAETRQIRYAANWLRVLGTDDTAYVNRDGVLFSIAEHMSDFKEDKVEVILVVFVPFEELPTAWRRYITAQACRVFSSRYLGDQAITQELMQEEQLAYAKAFVYEMDATKPSMTKNSELQQLINRG